MATFETGDVWPELDGLGAVAIVYSKNIQAQRQAWKQDGNRPEQLPHLLLGRNLPHEYGEAHYTYKDDLAIHPYSSRPGQERQGCRAEGENRQRERELFLLPG